MSNYAACHNDVEAPIDVNNSGVMFLNSHIGQKDVTDGTTHTIYVGEKLGDPTDLGWMSGTRATLRNTGVPPKQGMAQRDIGDAAGGTVPQGNDLTVGGFTSEHPGGCNFLFGDGSVHSLSYNVDPTAFRHLGSRADGELITSGPTRGG